MSILGTLGNVTTVAAPIGTTVYNCFDHKKGTFQFDYNKDKATATLKKAGTTVAATSVSGTLQLGGEISTTYLNDLYAGAMSIDQIEEMERLLAVKEEEFVVNGVAYDLTEVSAVEPVTLQTNPVSAKVLEKKISGNHE